MATEYLVSWQLMLYELRMNNSGKPFIFLFYLALWYIGIYVYNFSILFYFFRWIVVKT